MSRAARTAPIPRSPTTPAATGIARSARAPRRRNGSPTREAELLPVPYYHVVFTLPAPIADIAYQNKAVIYDLLFKASAETMLTIAADPKHLGARDRHHLRAAHLGLGADPSSARPHDRAGRRHLARRPALDLVPARLLPPRARALAAVPPAVPGEAHRRARGRPPRASSAITPSSPTRRPSRLISRRCARPNGSSTQSGRSADPRRCWPICRATPTASPSPTAA